VVSSRPPVTSGPADGVMSPTAYGPAALGAAGSAGAASSAGRCVKPTPAQPPPAVAPGPAPGCPVDPEGGPPKVPVVHVSFLGDAGGAGGVGGASVEAELVSSDHDTMRGLMYRKNMPEEHGMLFHLRAREDHQFWMHNTCIPLDLLYVDDDGLIVGIVENAPTLDDAPRGVDCPSRWVLEVNAGWCRRHHVAAGQHLALPPPPLRSDAERR